MSRLPIPGLREKILAAAREVFASKGYRGTPVREIAGLVGVTVGVLYLYFENKGELYLESLREGARFYKQGIREIESEEPEEAIRHYIKNHLEYSSIRKEGISLQFKDYDLEFARPFRIHFFAYQKKSLAGIISKGVQQGVFGVTDCGEAALFILYVLKGAVFNELAGTVNLAATEETLCNLVLSFLKQKPASRKTGVVCHKGNRRALLHPAKKTSSHQRNARAFKE